MSLVKKDNLLYFSVNDGSDMRIRKEIYSLNKKFNIYFVGIGNSVENCFVKDLCKEVKIVRGKIKSIASILKILFSAISIMRKINISSIHIQDEQLFFVSFFIFFKRKVVLDIFDSFFLKISKPNNELLFLKKIFYGLPQRIIVTDENRFNLLPDFARLKAVVIPNVPLYSEKYEKIQKTQSTELRIGLFGSVAKNRGAELASKILEADSNAVCYVAGWLSDEYSKNIVKNERVIYLGIKKQEEIFDVLAESIDFLLCIYPVNNLNNIYASPNKIYDATLTRTPVVINKQVKVSSLVEELRIGLVYDETSENIKDLINKMYDFKENSFINNDLSQKFTWQSYEDLLLSLHN